MAIAATNSNIRQRKENPFSLASDNKLANMSQSKAQESNPMALMSQSKAQESQRNNNIKASNSSNKDVKKNASQDKPKHSFLFALYSDTIKSFWKIITGVFAVEVVKGVLKDKNFSLAKVIDHTLKTDFLISFGAYMFGAAAIRLFNGAQKIFGMKIPKLPSAIVGHGASNIVAKIIGLITNTEILNAESAESGRSEVGKQVADKLAELPWVKNLKSFNVFYKNNIEGKLNKFFSTVFGVTRENLANGESKSKVNWLHFFGVNSLIGLGTFFLPKETQVYGMEDFAKSKGVWDTAKNAAIYFLASTLSRLDCYTFYSVLAMHPKGYGFKEIVQSTTRDRMFPPLLQTTFDIVSGLLNKYLPINGAMLASMVTMPIDIIGAFLSADQVGLAKETRVSSNWTYLSNKIWKPLSKKIESLVLPLFNATTKPFFYKAFFKFFPKEFEGKYEPIKERRLATGIEKKYQKENFLWLFAKSVAGIPLTLVQLMRESSLKETTPANKEVSLRQGS